MGLLGLCGDLRTMRDLLRLHESELVQTCKRKDRGEKTKCFFFRFKNKKIESEKKKEKNICTSVAVYILVPSKSSGHAIVGITIVGENFLSRKEFGKRKQYENLKFSYFFANSTIIFVWLAFYVSPTTQKEMK